MPDAIGRALTASLLFLLAAALALPGRVAAEGGSGVAVEIQQCSDPASGSPAGCSSTSATLAPEPRKAPVQQQVVVPAAPPAPRAEHHDVDLRRGVDIVRHADGTSEQTVKRD